MALIVIPFILAFLFPILVVLRKEQYRSWREGRPRLLLTTSELICLWSPVAFTTAAYLILCISFLRRALINATSTLLGLVCEAVPFSRLCVIASPLGDIAVLQVVGYLVFLCASLAFVWKIFIVGSQVPADFDCKKWIGDAQGTLTAVIGAGLWLFLAMGGQMYGGGAPTSFGILVANVLLLGGLLGIRAVCLRLKLG